jgi:hypothetical protein
MLGVSLSVVCWQGVEAAPFPGDSTQVGSEAQGGCVCGAGAGENENVSGTKPRVS